MTFRKPAIFMSTAALALGVAACGEEEPVEPATTATEEATQATPEPVAQIDTLSGVDTSVALEQSFLDALESLGVTPGAVGEAEITEQGEAVFPITGGEVTYYEPGTVSPFVQGVIEHSGGLSLTAGDTTVELTNFTIDPDTSMLSGQVSVNGEVAAQEAPLFFVDGSTLEPLETTEDGNAVLTGSTIKLTEEAATLLNDTFGIDDLQAGMEIGTGTVTLSS